MLKEETILACSREASFRRGQKYYEQGRVTGLQHQGDEWSAVVVGTENYRSRLGITNLQGACNCYAFDGDEWCKHIVALAFVAVRGVREDVDAPNIKSIPKKAKESAIQSMIDAATEEQMRIALASVIGRYPEVSDFVQVLLNPPALDTKQDIVTAVKQCLQPVKRARSWHRLTEASLQAQEEIVRIAQSVKPTKQTVQGLLAAAHYVYGQLAQIDDSDGTLQEACGTLCQRAVEIVNENPMWMVVIDEAIGFESEMPLIDYVLESGNERVAEHMLARLEKHLYKRDPGFPPSLADHADYILFGYLASHGDSRFVELLGEHKLHPNTELGMRARYHEARSEWAELVTLLWPKREVHMYRELLKRALAETKNNDKLIRLYIDETLNSYDVRRSVVQLQHLLDRYGRLDELPAVLDRLVARPTLPLEQRLHILFDLERYDDAAELMVSELDADAKKREKSTYYTGAPYATIDVITEYSEQFPPQYKAAAVKVWRQLFMQEVDRVLKSNQYDRFRLFGDKLVGSNELRVVQDTANAIVEKYPTRKKLVQICSDWL